MSNQDSTVYYSSDDEYKSLQGEQSSSDNDSYISLHDMYYTAPPTPSPRIQRAPCIKKKCLSCRRILRRTRASTHLPPPLSPITSSPTQESLHEGSSPWIWRPPTPKSRFNPNYVSTPVKSDRFFKSDKVYELEENIYKGFLKEKGVTLVMFYSPRDKAIQAVTREFKKVAETTKGKNHAFASVNCQRWPDFCETEDVQSTPFFKLYNKGVMYGNIEGYDSFNADDMKNFVDTFSPGDDSFL